MAWGEPGFLEALAGAGLEAGARERLGIFFGLLRRFERVTNLRGPGAANRAGEDTLGALVGLPFLREVRCLVDIGSGNGFPAIPLLVVSEGLRGVLLEPRERRWAFLCEVVREVGVEAEVRRERWQAHEGGPYEALTCRGVAARGWIGAAARLVRPGGLMLWWTREGKVDVEPGGRVLPSPVSTPGGGLLHVWRRCFT